MSLSPAVHLGALVKVPMTVRLYTNTRNPKTATALKDFTSAPAAAQPLRWRVQGTRATAGAVFNIETPTEQVYGWYITTDDGALVEAGRVLTEDGRVPQFLRSGDVIEIQAELRVGT